MTDSGTASELSTSPVTASDDPRLHTLSRRLQHHRPRPAPRRPETREAGVAVVLRTGEAMEILLIERVERQGDPWSGHMALPGGMREPADTDLAATALRETAEEVGIHLTREGRILGKLDELGPASRRLPPLVIAPLVATVPAGTPLVPEPAEVSTALWVPVDELLHPSALVETRFTLDGQELAFPAFAYQGYQVWGLTYRILRQFFAVAGLG